MIYRMYLFFLSLMMSFSAAQGASLPGTAPLTSAFTEGLIMEELLRVEGGDGFDVIIDKPRLPMGNQEAAPTDIMIDGFRLDRTTGRFSAVLLGSVGMTPRFQLPLEGRIETQVSVAVLSRPVTRGERISATDLKWIDIPSTKLPKAGLTDPDDIIGNEARRRLGAGRVLTSRDLGPPKLVRRGQPVRVVYLHGDLRLTALGTARDEGGYGEIVRVVNAESNVQLQGIATGPAEVTVGGQMPAGTSY